MNDFWVLLLCGLFSGIAGILVLIRENKLFKEYVSTTATVVKYYEYSSTTTNIQKAMYTMVVEYRLLDGTIIQAKEQSGSTNQKYPVGEEIQVHYSSTKPDFFVVEGDHSRKIVMVGMIIAGVFLIFLAFYVKQQA